MNDEIEVFGAGGQARNVMYVEDATEVLWRAVREPRLIGETYLAAGAEHLTVREIAESVVNVFQRGRVANVEWPDDRLRIEVGPVHLSSSRLQSVIDWKPRYDLTSGLERTRATMEQAASQGEGV